MIELVEKRQENSKTYDLGGRQRQLLASIGAVHYKDDYASDEPWKDIDLTWEGNRITKAPYELTLDGQKITIKDKKSGEISSIELLDSKPTGLKWEIVPENTRVSSRHTIPKVPFETKFKIVGKIPFLRTRAFDDEGELELETSIVDGILTEKLTSVKDKATGLVRLAKGGIRVDPTWQVTAGTDDCARRLAPDYFHLADWHWAGALSAVNYQYGGGMRFLNITIPQGATIATAYLILTASVTRSGSTGNTRISAEDVDDAITFANDSAAFDTRWAARTTARVNWDAIPAWTVETEYDSPEIKTVIKEIVDRGGWASGQDMVIFWDDFDDRSVHGSSSYRQAYSYDISTTKAPKLVITYTTGWVGGKVNGVANAAIGKINGVAIADITKVNGVA